MYAHKEKATRTESMPTEDTNSFRNRRVWWSDSWPKLIHPQVLQKAAEGMEDVSPAEL